MNAIRYLPFIILIVILFVVPIENPIDLAKALQPPSAAHLLGTDGLGRDTLLRVIEGGRTTIVLGLISTALVIVPGSILGIYSALNFERSIDNGIRTIVDGLMAFPNLALCLVIVAAVGQGWFSITIAVAISQFASFTRFARSSSISVVRAEFVNAAVSLGANRWWILRYHVLPGAISSLAAYSILVFSYIIMNIAALAYLGLSGDLSTAEWGQMIAENRQYLRIAPWPTVAPGIAITLVIVWLNYVTTATTRRVF